MKKKLIVGLDFDGVVAYNPARLARLPITLIKQHIFGINRVSFFVPKTDIQRALWALGHETSVFPAKGAALLRELTQGGVIEAHLVTARFGFLEEHLKRFLRRWSLLDVFESITMNEEEKQPHEYKLQVVQDKKFDYYVEDNWDIVNHLTRSKLNTEVHWIYNLFDRGRVYPHKHPYLEKALRDIVKR